MVIIDAKHERLKRHLAYVLLKDIYREEEIKSCPHCNKETVVKNGTYKNGQRYLCKACRRTFTAQTNTTLYNLKKNPIIFMEYIDLMLQKISLRKCAEKLNISLSTAFFWRHKILHAINIVNEPERLAQSVDMRKVFITENFKGDRKGYYEERKKVWTVIAVDDKEKILAKPVCIERWDLASFNEKIYKKLDKHSYIRAYGDRYLQLIAKTHNKEEKVRHLRCEGTFLSKYIREFLIDLDRFNGVATKYLSHYLSWTTLFPVEKKYSAKTILYRIGSEKCHRLRKEILGKRVLN